MLDEKRIEQQRRTGVRWCSSFLFFVLRVIQGDDTIVFSVTFRIKLALRYIINMIVFSATSSDSMHIHTYGRQ